MPNRLCSHGCAGPPGFPNRIVLVLVPGGARRVAAAVSMNSGVGWDYSRICCMSSVAQLDSRYVCRLALTSSATDQSGALRQSRSCPAKAPLIENWTWTHPVAYRCVPVPSVSSSSRGEAHRSRSRPSWRAIGGFIKTLLKSHSVFVVKGVNAPPAEILG